jgi:Concanavalin A-like lectin/glucanases superfamily
MIIGPLDAGIAPLGRARAANPYLRNLVSYWNLDEVSGTRFDAHGTNHLTDNATVTQAAGKVGNAASFITANAEYLSRTSNASLTLGDIDFTISAWVWMDSVMSQNAFVAKAGNECMLHCSGSFGFRFCMTVYQGGASTDRTVQSTFAVPTTGQWYFLVGWHNATADTVNISVNGGAADSTPTLGALATPAAGVEFRIGARVAVNQRYITGRVDEVGLWKRILTAAERTHLYNGGAGRTYPLL